VALHMWNPCDTYSDTFIVRVPRTDAALCVVLCSLIIISALVMFIYLLSSIRTTHRANTASPYIHHCGFCRTDMGTPCIPGWPHWSLLHSGVLWPRQRWPNGYGLWSLFDVSKFHCHWPPACHWLCGAGHGPQWSGWPESGGSTGSDEWDSCEDFQCP